MRYLRVGGRRERRFAGTNLEPRKLLENATTPTRRVHAVLGGYIVQLTHKIPDCLVRPSENGLPEKGTHYRQQDHNSTRREPKKYWFRHGPGRRENPGK